MLPSLLRFSRGTARYPLLPTRAQSPGSTEEPGFHPPGCCAIVLRFHQGRINSQKQPETAGFVTTIVTTRKGRSPGPSMLCAVAHQIMNVTPIHIRIREARESRGWTQGELAKRAGITQATVSRIETGKVASLDLDVFEKLAAALEVHPATLIERKD